MNSQDLKELTSINMLIEYCQQMIDDIDPVINDAIENTANSAMGFYNTGFSSLGDTFLRGVDDIAMLLVSQAKMQILLAMCATENAESAFDSLIQLAELMLEDA